MIWTYLNTEQVGSICLLAVHRLNSRTLKRQRSWRMPWPSPYRARPKWSRTRSEHTEAFSLAGCPTCRSVWSKTKTSENPHRISMGPGPFCGGGQRVCPPAGPSTDLGGNGRWRDENRTNAHLQGNNYLLQGGQTEAPGTTRKAHEERANYIQNNTNYIQSAGSVQNTHQPQPQL